MLGFAAAALLASCADAAFGASPTTPVAATGEADQVLSLPGYGDVATRQYAGYASITNAPCASIRCDGAGENGLFYWLVTKHADRKSTRLNSSHLKLSRMPSSA